MLDFLDMFGSTNKNKETEDISSVFGPSEVKDSKGLKGLLKREHAQSSGCKVIGIVSFREKACEVGAKTVGSSKFIIPKGYRAVLCYNYSIEKEVMKVIRKENSSPYLAEEWRDLRVELFQDILIRNDYACSNMELLLEKVNKFNVDNNLFIEMISYDYDI